MPIWRNHPLFRQPALQKIAQGRLPLARFTPRRRERAEAERANPFRREVDFRAKRKAAEGEK